MPTPSWVISKLKADQRKEERQKTPCLQCTHRRSVHTSSRGHCHARPFIAGEIVPCECEKFKEVTFKC